MFGLKYIGIVDPKTRVHNPNLGHRQLMSVTALREQQELRITFGLTGAAGYGIKMGVVYAVTRGD